MKVALLAGGLGTRISEETTVKPKPMVEIGGFPVLWHIMSYYSFYGFNEFIICLGYKGYVIKEYFANYFLHNSDVTIDLERNTFEYHHSYSKKWKITLVETGAETMTGGRIKRIKKYTDNKPFMFTYGDGLSDININELVKNHKISNKLITVSCVKMKGRFGELEIEDGSVKSFVEKPPGTGPWINGGYFVCQPEVFDYIKDDSSIFEREPMENLAKNSQMNSYQHTGFWKPMDTLRDKNELNELWNNNLAKWKVW